MITTIKNKLSGNSLSARFLRGSAALAIGSIFERGLRFVVNMILARLLVPDQFGLMAIVVAATGLFETLTEVGVQQAIVQNKRGETDSFLNVAWWFSGIRGTALYLIGIIAAPFVAVFYAEPELTPLLRVAFLTMLFQGLTNPRLYVLQKRLQFSRYVWIVQGSALLGTLLCLGLALWTPNVWSLVAGVVAQAAFRCVGSFLFCSFSIQVKFDRESLEELFGFSRGMIGMPLLTFLFLQADVFVLGQMVNKDRLGCYAMASALSQIPLMFFSKIINPMILPAFSEMQDQKERLKDNFFRMTKVLYSFGLPMVVFLVIFARPILVISYGVGYAQSSVVFAILNIYTLFYMSSSLIASMYFAIGRPEIHRLSIITQCMTMVILVYPAVAWWQSTGAAIAKLVSMVIAGVVQLIVLRRLIDMPFNRYIQSIINSFIVSLIAGLVLILFRYSVDSVPLQLAGGIAICSFTWLIGVQVLQKKSNS